MRQLFASFAAWAVVLGAPIAVGAMSYVDPMMYYAPQTSWCGSYGYCQIGTQHTFAPYTYVNVDPYIYTNVGTYQYPMQVYTYPNQQSYNYSYPQYQGYSQGSYNQPNYGQSYGYSSYPAYTPYYMWGDEYGYSGYGCYPFYVEDPHQWVYDSWTGTWY